MTLQELKVNHKITMRVKEIHYRIAPKKAFSYDNESEQETPH